MAEPHVFVGVLPLISSGANAKNQSLWCATAKGYAESGTFYVTSLTPVGLRFTLLELIGSLNPSDVTLITVLSDLGVTSSQLDRIERCGNDPVTIKRELFLDNLYKAPKDTDHETAENGSSGVKTTTMPNHSTFNLAAQNRSNTALGARLPRLSGGLGRNIVGAKKAPSELARTGGASLCHLSKRDVVKAIPQNQSVRWFPAASLSGDAMGTGSLRADLSWWKSASDEDRSAPERCGDVQGLTHLGKR